MYSTLIFHCKSSFYHLKICIVFWGLWNSPFTVSWAVERLFPAKKTTGPDMELSVEVRHRLWRVPSLSMFTAVHGSRTSPFKVHFGGLPDFRLVSTWNSAGSGSITSTDFIPRTMLIACSACTVTIHINTNSWLITLQKNFWLHHSHLRIPNVKWYSTLNNT